MRQTQPQCCGNSKCQTTSTPLWRKGWFSQEGKTIMLCNACGLHYKKGHYCMYCNQIYRESDADDNANPWIGCDRCSRWVHQKCEEANGHHWKQHSSYQCPDCRCAPPASEATKIATIPINTTTTATTTNPGTQMRKRSSQGQKKRRRTPSGAFNDSPITPNTPISPITPGSNFILFSQPEQKTEPMTHSVFEANTNAMPCWNQLQATIQSLPAAPTDSSPSTPTNSRKRKLDSTTTTTTKQKKSRTTTTITTTTTHRMNSAGIDALMGVVEEKEVLPHLDLHITTTVRKGKQTSRKMNADARSAAIAPLTDTPTTPTSFFSPPLFATMTTTTTTVASADENAKNNASLSEEQFYQYQQLIMKQQNEQKEKVEVSSEPIAKQAPVTILQNTFGSVDTLGNFYGSFNEQLKQTQESSPYGLLSIDEDYEMAETRRPQKRVRRVSPPKKVTTTTTTLTMTVSSASSHVKSKRVRDQIAKNGGNRIVYSGTSSDTEDSEYEQPKKTLEPSRWEEAAKALNVDLDDAYSILTTRFPSAPVLKKMGSLWALCEVIRGQTHAQ